MEFNMIGFLPILFLSIYVVFLSLGFWVLCRFINNLEQIFQKKYKESVLRKFKTVFFMTFFMIIQQQAIHFGLLTFTSHEIELMFYLVVYGSPAILCLVLLHQLMRISLHPTDESKN